MYKDYFKTKKTFKLNSQEFSDSKELNEENGLRYILEQAAREMLERFTQEKSEEKVQ